MHSKRTRNVFATGPRCPHYRALDGRWLGRSSPWGTSCTCSSLHGCCLDSLDASSPPLPLPLSDSTLHPRWATTSVSFSHLPLLLGGVGGGRSPYRGDTPLHLLPCSPTVGGSMAAEYGMQLENSATQLISQALSSSRRTLRPSRSRRRLTRSRRTVARSSRTTTSTTPVSTRVFSLSHLPLSFRHCAFRRFKLVHGL